jgi:hypothetical protein
MDKLFEVGIKLAYQPGHNFILEHSDETELSKVQRIHTDCTLIDVCVDCTKYQKYVSILLVDTDAEQDYAIGDFVGENSEHLVSRLK